MAEQSTKQQGDSLELEVANLYRSLGAKKVIHDVELGGNQIDVYIEMDCPDGAVHRVAVEAKNWNKKVGIDVVNQFALVVRNLKDLKQIDEGVIVSNKDFSREAKEAMEQHGLRPLVLDDLRAFIDKSSSKATISSFAYTFISIFETKVISMVEESTRFLGRPIPQVYLKIAGSIGGSLVGALNGLILVWYIANQASWSYSTENFAGGVIIGAIVGVVVGWRIGLAIWIIPLGIVSVVHIGAIIGGTVGIISGIGRFSSSFDGLIFGATIGAIEGLLLRPRVLDVVEKQLGGPLIREIIRMFVSLTIGICFGGVVGYSIHEAVIKKVVVFEMNALNGMFFGIVFGTSLSVVVASMFIFLFLGIFIDKWIGHIVSPFMSAFMIIKNRMARTKNSIASSNEN